MKQKRYFALFMFITAQMNKVIDEFLRDILDLVWFGFLLLYLLYPFVKRIANEA